jgi:hypothetical protein
MRELTLIALALTRVQREKKKLERRLAKVRACRR